MNFYSLVPLIEIFCYNAMRVKAVNILDKFLIFGLIKVSHKLSHIRARQKPWIGDQSWLLPVVYTCEVELEFYKDFIHEELMTRNEGIRLVKFLTNSQIANSWSCFDKIDFPSICGGEICYLTFLECPRMKIFDHISLLLQGSKFLLHFYDLAASLSLWAFQKLTLYKIT